MENHGRQGAARAWLEQGSAASCFVDGVVGYKLEASCLADAVAEHAAADLAAMVAWNHLLS